MKLEMLGVTERGQQAVGDQLLDAGQRVHGADGLEESYSVGPCPQREMRRTTIGGDWFGHVDSTPWTMELADPGTGALRAYAGACCVAGLIKFLNFDLWC
jgi:hypothetical protein